MDKATVPNTVKAVIFDWAGTLVDFGSIAPVIALSELFAEHGVSLTADEVRAPMGLLKRDHIRTLLEMERVAAVWKAVHGSQADEETVGALNEELEQHMPEIAARLAAPLPGTVETLQRLRAKGIRIGSTTGYPRTTMNAVQAAAADAGIVVDALYTPSEVPAGRPRPWMIFRNCIDLDAYPPGAVIKVGDTLQDIYEGLNAGVWAVGVVIGSSLLGLSADEFAQLDRDERTKRLEAARQAFSSAGAHYVIESMDGLDAVLADVEHRLTEEPNGRAGRK
jgi:phosphonoacetaldehyde hydrolase